MNEEEKPATENIISLEERRKGRDKKDTAAPARDEPRATGIKMEKELPADFTGAEGALPGQLVWLHCPTCGTYQYSEMAMDGGRQHNACGTVVEEVAVAIDVRAEMTMAEFNLERLSGLADFLDAERRNYEEYRKRLQLVAGKKVSGYKLDEESMRRLPVAEISPLGLLIPKALAHPEALFRSEEGQIDSNEGQELPIEPSQDGGPDATPEG